jgi:hypothetical protein
MGRVKTAMPVLIPFRRSFLENSSAMRAEYVVASAEVLV